MCAPVRKTTQSPLHIYDSDLVRMLCYDAIMSITLLSNICQDLYGISQKFQIRGRVKSETSKQIKSLDTRKTGSV